MNNSNSNNISNSINPSSASASNSAYNSPYSSPGSPGSSNSSNSLVSFLQNITWFTWVIIILLLAVLGFNIFVYLSKGTQYTANIIKWFSNIVGTQIVDTSKQTVNVSTIGAETAINTVDDATKEMININDIPGKQAVSSQSPNEIQYANANANANARTTYNSVDDSLDKALDKALDRSAIKAVEADDSYSSIQRSKGSGKGGWCFIGEDKGIRSCVELGVNDKCMSGDIFPTNEICVNPNLRA